VRVCARARVCVCLLSDNDICFSIVAITLMQLRYMWASVKQFDTQHLKWCDLVNLFVVLIGHTTLEIVRFGHCISCLKLYESERSKHKTNLTYNI
jgi:hypothetical protein